MTRGAEVLGVPISAALMAVRRVRGLWRRAVLARAFVLALALLLGLAASLALLDLGLGFPAASRRLLRFLPLLGAALPLLGAIRRLVPGPDDRRIALLIEERRPALDGILSTALEPLGTGEVARSFQRRVESRLATLDFAGIAPLRLRRSASLFGLASLGVVVALAVAPAGGKGLWQHWTLPVDPPTLAAGAVAGAGQGARPGESAGPAPAAHPGFGVIRLTIEPPAYSGLPAWEWTGDGVVAALPGSRIRLRGQMPAGAGQVTARVIGSTELTGRFPPVDETGVDGASPAAAAPTKGRAGRIGTADPKGATSARAAADSTGKADSPEISTAPAAPASWTTAWTTGGGDRGLSLEGLAAGDVVVRRIIPLTVLPDEPPFVELELPAADMVFAAARGEVLIRARARDDYGVGEFELAWIRSRGSGESFSFDEGRYQWSRVVREGASLHGEFRLDLADAGLEPGDVVHLRAVARDRNTVTGPSEGVSRTRILRIARDDEMAEVTVLAGFPIEAEREPVLSQRMVILLTERLLETASSLTRDALVMAAAEIAEEQARLRRQVGDQALAPTSGAGDAGDDGGDHDHDADPVLAVNRPLLEAYNAMWSAEGELRIAALTESLPFQYQALRILQEAREADRIFLRGRVPVAPVDIAAARGTGELDEAAPAPRTAGMAAPSAAARVAELEALLAQVRREDARSAALALAGLAARFISDPAVDPAAAALVARAAEAAEGGQHDAAVRLLLEARGRLAPAGLVAGATRLPGAGGARAAAYFRALGGMVAGADAPARPSPSIAPAPFVFATVRYESGDWDSAPLVPANLIHAVAQYTEIPVAPEGVVVDLATSEIFRYPILFLTGHLPVRLNDAESRNLEAYIERGGLLFIDDHNHDIDGAFHRTLTAELARIFGADALRPLPNDHELYSTFFVFEDGPPITSHELNGWGDGLIHEELFAIERGGRIGVLYSNKDYSSEWSYHVVNKRFLAVDNTRFGVNLIIYGLTR